MKSKQIYILIFTLAVLVILLFILGYVPPVSKDALTHHLAVPKLYLKHGGIYEIPSIKFSYYPMNLDLLYIIPLYFGNDIVPKYIHFVFAVLTALLLFNYLRFRLGRSYALFSSLLFLSIPIIVKLSITVYVDLGLIFFSTAAFIYLFKWIEKSFRLKYLIISALFCGLAMGTKYNGFITLLLLTAFIPIMYLRSSKISYQQTVRSKNILKNRAHNIIRQVKPLGYSGIFLGVALIVFSPWMIKNYVWTKNPVYPLYNNFFKSIRADRQDDTKIHHKNKKAPFDHFSVRKIIYKETVWQTVFIPIRIFFWGKDDDPAFFDGKLNPFLCLLPIFAFAGRKRDSRMVRHEKIALLAFSIIYLLIVYFQIDMRIRWISPIIPPLVILSVYGLKEIVTWATDKMYPKKALFGTIFIFLIAVIILYPNGKYILGQFRYVDPVPYIRGRISRDDYISKFRPEYSVIQYANRHVPADKKIYCLFLGLRRYYSDRELIFFDVSRFLKIMKSPNPSDLLLSEIKKTCATHILVGFDLLDKWSLNNLSEKERQILVAFFHKHTKLLFSNGRYGLFLFN